MVSHQATSSRRVALSIDSVSVLTHAPVCIAVFVCACVIVHLSRNLPLIDKLHPLRLSNYDARASDPSYASTLPYSSLASSVTENDLHVNVQLSYYFYLVLMTLLFGVGASIQSIRRRPCMPLYESLANSRRNSAHHLLLGGGANKKPSLNLNGGLLPASYNLNRTASFSEGGVHAHSYGSTGAAAALSVRVDGRYSYRPRSTSDEQRGAASATTAAAAAAGQLDPPQRLFAPRPPNSGSASPLRSALAQSNRSAQIRASGPGARRSMTPRQDWSRRTSFTLAVDVGRPTDTTLHVSRSPSAPALSALDAELLQVATTATQPSQQHLGGIAGSLKRMRHAALAQKIAPVSARSKKKISFMNEFGLAVHPQRTPTPPSDTEIFLQQKALRPVGIDVSAGETTNGGGGGGVVVGGGGSLPFGSPEAGSKSVPILSPAWSPYPLITPEAVEEYTERERHTAQQQPQQQWQAQT